MIRAVLDANVFLSGVLGFGAGTTPPAKVLRLWVAGRFGAVTSDPVRGEIERTLLTKPYSIARVEQAAGRGWVAELAERAIESRMDMEVRGVASHPQDDLILATAVSGDADYLVTGTRSFSPWARSRTSPSSARRSS